jgi:hypothetical protein
MSCLLLETAAGWRLCHPHPISDIITGIYVSVFLSFYFTWQKQLVFSSSSKYASSSCSVCVRVSSSSWWTGTKNSYSSDITRFKHWHSNVYSKFLLCHVLLPYCPMDATNGSQSILLHTKCPPSSLNSKLYICWLYALLLFRGVPWHRNRLEDSPVPLQTFKCHYVHMCVLVFVYVCSCISWLAAVNVSVAKCVCF